MANVIPYFYYDLLARIVPGVLVLLLVSLMKLPLPEQWSAWIPREGAAQAVLLPLWYGGLAYLLGLGLEVFSIALRPVNRLAALAVFFVEWCPADESSNGTAKPQKETGRRTPSELLQQAWYTYQFYTEEHLPKELPHGLRYHAEAKCFSHLAVVIGGFLILVWLDRWLGFSWMEVKLARSWYWFAAGSSGLSLVCCFLRLHRRHRRVINVLRQWKDHPLVADMWAKLSEGGTGLRAAKWRRRLAVVIAWLA